MYIIYQNTIFQFLNVLVPSSCWRVIAVNKEQRFVLIFISQFLYIREVENNETNEGYFVTRSLSKWSSIMSFENVEALPTTFNHRYVKIDKADSSDCRIGDGAYGVVYRALDVSLFVDIITLPLFHFSHNLTERNWWPSCIEEDQARRRRRWHSVDCSKGNHPAEESSPWKW